MCTVSAHELAAAYNWQSILRSHLEHLVTEVNCGSQARSHCCLSCLPRRHKVEIVENEMPRAVAWRALGRELHL